MTRMLANKVAIVTGAARGIGLATAERFLREGAAVTLADSREELLQTEAQRLQNFGSVLTLAGDLSDDTYCQQVVRRTIEVFEELNILVNNAGIARFSPFITHSRADWDETIAVNLTAVFVMSQVAARAMLETGNGGVILSTASNNGHVPEPDVIAYNAAKAGVIAITKSIAIELGGHGIRANCIAPGHIGPTALATDGGADDEFIENLTSGIPLGRIGKVSEVASLFAYLASDEAPFINGESIIIDGGQLARQA